MPSNQNNDKFLELVFSEIMAISKGSTNITPEIIAETEDDMQKSVLGGLLYLNQDLDLYRAELRAKMNELERLHQGELQAKMVELEKKNKELIQFNYIASHDLQEPLRTVTSFSKILAKENHDKLDQNGKDYLHFILQASQRMQLLIHELLDYSRIGRNKVLAKVNCNELLEQLEMDMNAAFSENNTQLNYQELPTLVAYSTELRQLFQNLLSNAIKFKQKDIDPIIHISATQMNDHWLFKVKDNGIGIPEKYLEKIFGIFQRLHSKKKYEGTGIGLAHCKKIVDLHNGDIWIESELNVGSTFHFTIPINLTSKINEHDLIEEEN